MESVIYPQVIFKVPRLSRWKSLFLSMKWQNSFLPTPFGTRDFLSSRDVLDKINEPIRASERKSFGSSLLLCKLAC